MKRKLEETEMTTLNECGAVAWTIAHRFGSTASEARELAAAIDAELGRLRAALKPFADLGIGSGPDDQQGDYRLEYGAIRAARAAIEKSVT